MTHTYGYAWADWLYGPRKDKFMASVYDACHKIDKCGSPVMKSQLIGELRKLVHGSRKAWVEGIEDFLEFEEQRLHHGTASMEVLGDSDDHRVLAVLDAGHRHGAFRGLCRTEGGAEWIGHLGEVCAAAVHQGFKWVRVSGGAEDWELKALGEAWCKGSVMWGLASMYVAVDVAGTDKDNDEALARVHTVIAAHHMAGAVWKGYRGEHPHVQWDRSVRGRAPSGEAIHRFGRKRRWPEPMIDVLVRGAVHVNTWTNPPPDPVHLDRARGLMIGSHTPRLHARVVELCRELSDVLGGVTDSEATELETRIATWLDSCTTRWRARGDDTDRVIEVHALGAAWGVARESRPHLTSDDVDRAVEWSRERIGHLDSDQQAQVLEAVRVSMAVRGRVPGLAGRYGSAGAGTSRFIDGLWVLSNLCTSLAEQGGPPFPSDLHAETIRFFNSGGQSRRIEGRDYPVGADSCEGCYVCAGDELFRRLIDNRPSTAVLQASIWGVLLYCNLGLGEPDDQSLGTR